MARKSAERDVVEAELMRVRETAMKDFGTSDPDELEARARQMEAEFVSKVDEFASKIDSIYAELGGLGISP